MVHQIPQHITDGDIRYFQEKLNITKDQPCRDRISKQIEMLEDAVVIYQITRGE